MNDNKFELEKTDIINTFIITTFHDKFILRCLSSLLNTVDRSRHRIVLIEGQAEEERTFLYEKTKDIVDIYIKTKKNYGFAQSINLGIMISRTPYFTVVHDDVWFIHKGWWEDTRKAFDQDPNLLMVQPNQRARREKKPLEDFPSEDVYQKLLKEAGWGSVAEVYCMIFKHEFVDVVGYFDESIYPVGPEDVELFDRITARNYRAALCPWAIVFHRGLGRETVVPKLDFIQSGAFDRSYPLKPGFLRQL